MNKQKCIQHIEATINIINGTCLRVDQARQTNNLIACINSLVTVLNEINADMEGEANDDHNKPGDNVRGELGVGTDDGREDAP